MEGLLEGGCRPSECITTVARRMLDWIATHMMKWEVSNSTSSSCFATALLLLLLLLLLPLPLRTQSEASEGGFGDGQHSGYVPLAHAVSSSDSCTWWYQRSSNISTFIPVAVWLQHVRSYKAMSHTLLDMLKRTSPSIYVYIYTYFVSFFFFFLSFSHIFMYAGLQR